MPYLYCFKVKGLFNEKVVYKFGKTNQNNVLDRLSGYSGLNKPSKLIIISYVENADLLEKKILKDLRENYNFAKELGNEYFYHSDEKELHKFLKQKEIEYYNYSEEEEIKESKTNPTRIDCPFSCKSPRASKEAMINHLEKQCKRRPSNTAINTIKSKTDSKLLAIDSNLERLVSEIWNSPVTDKIKSYTIKT
jgi:hypothetical protein